MKKVKIETNFYGWILWNIPLLWRSHNTIVEKESAGLSSSNVYQKDAEINSGGIVSRIKTNNIDSQVSKVSFLQISLMKYLLPLIFVYMFNYMNTYYPSMVGLCLGSITYLIFWQLVRRVNLMVGYIFILSIIGIYAYLVVLDFNAALYFNLSSILNYAVQYFIYLMILEIVVVDMFVARVKPVYKILNMPASYFSVLDANSVKLIDTAKKRGRAIFALFLGICVIVGFILGGADLWREIEIRKAAQVKVSKKIEEEKQILELKNYEAFKYNLDKSAKKVGINYHSDSESLSMMKNDLEAYKKNKIVGYDKIKITRTNSVLRLEDAKMISLARMKHDYILRPSYVKMYKGVYRWHFLLNGKVHVVVNSTAR